MTVQIKRPGAGLVPIRLVDKAAFEGVSAASMSEQSRSWLTNIGFKATDIEADQQSSIAVGHR